MSVSAIPNKHKLPSHELFRIGQMKPVIKPTRPHGHKAYYELIFLTEGSGKHTIELRDYEVKPGMIFWLKPGQIHCWDFSRIPGGYVLMFRSELIDQHPVIQLQGMHWLEQLPAALNLSPSHLNWINRLIQNLIELPEDALYQQANYLILLLQHMEEAASMQPLEYTGPKQTSFTQFQKLIEQHYLNRLPIIEYARQLAISERKLNQICKELSGGTARELINERMLLEAKRLLMHTSLTISEIAYELNFHDPSHFVKFFKKQANLTPGEFQQKIQVKS